jgi:hypothetical protein
MRPKDRQGPRPRAKRFQVSATSVFVREQGSGDNTRDFPPSASYDHLREG